MQLSEKRRVKSEERKEKSTKETTTFYRKLSFLLSIRVEIDEQQPQKVGSAVLALRARLQANRQNKRDLLRKRRSDEVNERWLFKEKSPRKIRSPRRCEFKGQKR